MADGGVAQLEQAPGVIAGSAPDGGAGGTLGVGVGGAAAGAPAHTPIVGAFDAQLGGGGAQPPTPGPLLMEPLVHGITQTLYNLLNSLQDVCSAVGLVDSPNSLTMIGIINLLGDSPNQHVPMNVVADLTEQEFETHIVQQFNICSPPSVDGGQPVSQAPSLGQVARMRRVRTICIAKTSVAVPGVGTAVDAAALQSQIAQLVHFHTQQVQAQAIQNQQLNANLSQQQQLLQQAKTHPTDSASGSVAKRKLKLKEIIDQISEEECEVMSETALAAAYARYEALFGEGESPPVDEDPTEEQLSALNHLLNTNLCPYVDFGIFGPHGHRILKKVKLISSRFNNRNELVKIELNGPATYAMWCASWNVFKNTMIMLDAVDLGKLCAYKRKLDVYYERHGEKAWALLYQTDVRTRNEHFGRVKREAIASYNKTWDDLVAVIGRTEARDKFVHAYDPNRPWDFVFGQVAKEQKWWFEEFELPVLSTVGLDKHTMSHALEGDARIERAGGNLFAGPKRTLPAADASGHTSHQGTAHPLPPQGQLKRQRLRMHNVDTSSGTYKTSRNGVALCEAYNSGGCTVGTGNRCPADPSKLHICSKCLQYGHRAQDCQNAPKPPSGGKGKGKGKKGKKGGGKGWWQN